MFQDVNLAQEKNYFKMGLKLCSKIQFLFWSCKEFGNLNYRRGDAQGHPSWGESREPSQLQSRPGTGESVSGRGLWKGNFMCFNGLCRNPLHDTSGFNKVLLNRQPGPSYHVGNVGTGLHICSYT